VDDFAGEVCSDWFPIVLSSGINDRTLNLCHNDVSIGRGVAAIVPHEDVQFLTLVMMTLRGFLKATFRGSTFPSVTSAQLNNYRLPKPPLNEQRAIAVAVAGETAHVDSVMERARREIDLLREYRTRLLADVVTGKRDVRGVELPALDEAEALEDWETEEDAQADEVEEMEDVDA